MRMREKEKFYYPGHMRVTVYVHKNKAIIQTIEKNKNNDHFSPRCPIKVLRKSLLKSILILQVIRKEEMLHNSFIKPV